MGPFDPIDPDDPERRRLEAVKVELALIEVEARRLLEVCATYLNALARAADDDAPQAGQLSDRITAVLDRRRLAEVEVYELAAEMRESRDDPPRPLAPPR